MSEFLPLESLEELAEELLANGEGIPEDAGVTCPICSTDVTVPWALREQLEGAVADHLERHGLRLEDVSWGDEPDEDEEDDED